MRRRWRGPVLGACDGPRGPPRACDHVQPRSRCRGRGACSDPVTRIGSMVTMGTPDGYRNTVRDRLPRQPLGDHGEQCHQALGRAPVPICSAGGRIWPTRWVSQIWTSGPAVTLGRQARQRLFAGDFAFDGEGGGDEGGTGVGGITISLRSATTRLIARTVSRSRTPFN